MQRASIFISYRRSDSSAYAGRLYDALARAYPRESVFMDVDNIRPGEDFVDVLTARVAECGAILVIIGRSWLETRDGTGARRLDDPGDFVRVEVGAALSRGVLVIPVLVDGAVMPAASDLPDDLKVLARRNAFTLSHERFSTDVGLLTAALRRDQGQRRPWLLPLAAGLALLVAFGAVTAALLWSPPRAPEVPGPAAPSPGPVARAPSGPEPAFPPAGVPPLPVRPVPEPPANPPVAVPVAPPVVIPPVAAPAPPVRAPSPARESPEAKEIPAPPRAATTAFVTQSHPDEVDPGRRLWSRVAPDSWVERYPSGHTDELDFVRRTVLEGCQGALIRKRAEPAFTLFVPDADCPLLVVRWRRGAGAWMVLARMTDVRPSVARR